MQKHPARSLHRVALSVAMIMACSQDTTRIQALDDPPVAFRVELDLRIDGSGADSEQFMSSIAGLKIDESGRILAADVNESRITMFDSTGRWIRNIGRQGNGPGEFSSIGTFGFFSDSIWVIDPDAKRVQLFLADGSFARMFECSVQPSDPTAYSSAPPAAYLGNGRVLARLEPKSWQGIGDSVRLPDLLVTATESGVVADTLSALPMPWSEIIHYSTTSMSRPYPIRTTPYFVVAPRTPELAVVLRPDPTDERGGVYKVVRYHGDQLGSDTVVMSYSPRRVDQRIIDSLIPWPETEDLPALRDLNRARREHARWPKFLPAVNRTIIGRDGSLWLANDWSLTPSRWLVLSPDNRVVGAVDLPQKLRVLQADTMRVWGVELSDSDVPSVVRYRLVSTR